VRKDILVAVIAVVVVAAVAFGLSTMNRDLPLTPSNPFGTEKASATGEKKVASNEKIVMHVNGEPITEREFNAFLEVAPEQARALYSSPAGRRALAGELVKLKTLEQEAERLGLDKDPDVQTQVELMRAQITAGRALEKLVNDSSEGKVKAAYEKEKKNFIVLRHIAVAYEGGAIPARDQKAISVNAAMAKAQEIAKRLRAGADFTRTAVAESDDTRSAQQGGALGALKLSDLPQNLGPEIAAAINKLGAGQISDPVKTQFAVHIFKRDEASLEDVRPNLVQEVKQQTVEEELARLEKNAKVEYDPQFFPEQKPATPPASSKQNQ
jgi:peptidyl-prolyl cis-trans isomerase C